MQYAKSHLGACSASTCKGPSDADRLHPVAGSRLTRAGNPLERVNREIKRRADVIDIFPNDDAIIRLVGALMLETNHYGTVARCDISLETIARVTESPTVRLPAVAY